MSVAHKLNRRTFYDANPDKFIFQCFANQKSVKFKWLYRWRNGTVTNVSAPEIYKGNGKKRKSKVNGGSGESVKIWLAHKNITGVICQVDDLHGNILANDSYTVYVKGSP